MCNIHTHTYIHPVVLTYVCRSNAPGKKVLSAFAVLLAAAAATAAQQSLSANTQQQALTGTRTTTPNPLPTPTPSLTTTVAAIYMQCKVQKAKGKVKNKSKKTLTISCSSRIKCKCKQQLASIVKSKVCGRWAPPPLARLFVLFPLFIAGINDVGFRLFWSSTGFPRFVLLCFQFLLNQVEIQLICFGFSAAAAKGKYAKRRYNNGR